MERTLTKQFLFDMVIAYQQHYTNFNINAETTATQLKHIFEKYYSGTVIVQDSVKIWEYVSKKNQKVPVFVIKFYKKSTKRHKRIMICYNFKKLRWDFYRIPKEDYENAETAIFYDNFIEKISRDK